MLVAAAIAADIMSERNGRRRAVNKQQYGCRSTEDLCLSANDAILTIFSNSLAELISGLDLDQSGAFRLVFWLSQKAQPRTKPKSEVTQCLFEEVISSIHHSRLITAITWPRCRQTNLQ